MRTLLKVALAPAIIVLSTAANSAEPRITIVNHSGQSLYNLFVDGSEGDWIDQLGEDDVIIDGEEHNVALKSDCTSDLKAVFKNGRTVLLRDVDVCRAPKWQFGTYGKNTLTYGITAEAAAAREQSEAKAREAREEAERPARERAEKEAARQMRIKAASGLAEARYGETYTVTKENSKSDGLGNSGSYVHSFVIRGKKGDRFKITVRSINGEPGPNAGLNLVSVESGSKATRLTSLDGMKIGDPESVLTFQLVDDGAHVYEIDQPAFRLVKTGQRDLFTGQDMYRPVAADPRPYTVLVEKL